MKKRIFEAMTYSEKYEQNTDVSGVKKTLPGSGRPKFAGATTKLRRRSRAKDGSRKERRSRSVGGNRRYKQAGKSKSGLAYKTPLHGNRRNRAAVLKNQWGEWQNEFEAKGFQWLQKNATYVQRGPQSGKLQYASCPECSEASAESGDPYKGLRGSIIFRRLVKPKCRLKPGQRLK